jgi:hypothetical protein
VAMAGHGGMTVNVARALAKAHGRDWVVVVAQHEEGVQYITWGVSPEDKVYASELAREFADAGCSVRKQTFEDYKLDAAKNKARAERLEEACGLALKVIGRQADRPAEPFGWDWVRLAEKLRAAMKDD